MEKLNELCQKYGTAATIEQQKEIIEAGKELEVGKELEAGKEKQDD